MNPSALIARLRNIDADLYVKGDKLFCDFPKGASDPVLLHLIKTNKSELISLLNTESDNLHEPYEPDFRTIKRDAISPLSFAQKRMMVLNYIQSNEAVFNIHLSFEFDGALDIPKLDAVLRKTAERHELLRTCFKWVNDEPAQEIVKEPMLKTCLIDLNSLAEKHDTSLLQQVIEQELKKPFDIGRAPLFRFVLIQSGNNHSILLLISHHLVSDEKSLWILAEEISHQYSDIPEGRTIANKHQYQYVDYISWENEYLKSPSGETQLQFWVNRFQQIKNSDMISIGSGEINTRMIESSQSQFEIPEDLTLEMESYARAHQVTLFMVSYAAFIILAARIYSKNKFCCGTSFVNRTRIEIENMIGYFANTLILKNELVKNQSFTELLVALKENVIETFANGDIPFEYALVNSNMPSNPFTQLFFTYAEDDQKTIKFGNMVVRPYVTNINMPQNATTELSLYVRKNTRQLECTIIYDPQLFDPVFTECFRKDYVKLVTAVIRHPETKIDDLLLNCERNNSYLKKSDKLLSTYYDIPPKSSETIHIPPRNEMEHLLLNIWTDILGDKTISVNDDFFLLGGTSFQAVKMFSALHRKTGMKLAISTLFHSPTIESLALAIERENREQWSPIVPIQTKGEKPPLFFVHGAGGNVLLYRALSNRLGTDQPFYGIQAKGLDGRSEFLSNIEDMAVYYVKEIRKIQPEGPYYLGGYCLGGQIAYEMARNLDASGDTVAFVALLDTQRRWNSEKNFLLNLHHFYQQVTFHIKNFLCADFRGKTSFLKEKIVVSARRIQRRLLVLIYMIAFSLRLRSDKPMILMEHINDLAAEKYIALPYNGKITLFRPKKNYAGYEDPLMGWGNDLTKGVDLQNLSAYPAGMLIEPFVAELAEKIKACLDRARQATLNEISTIKSDW